VLLEDEDQIVYKLGFQSSQHIQLGFNDIGDPGDPADSFAVVPKLADYASPVYRVQGIVGTNQSLTASSITWDGGTYGEDSLVWLNGQTDPVENGPWIIDQPTWVRPFWFQTGAVVPASITIRCTNGNTLSNTTWHLLSEGATVGTDAVYLHRADGGWNALSVNGTGNINLGTAMPYAHAGPRLALVFYAIAAGGLTLTLPPIGGQGSPFPVGSEILVKDRANIAATRNITLNAATGNQVEGGTSTTLNTNRGRVHLLAGPATAAGGSAEWSIITRV
jgi:hypothetical protein